MGKMGEREREREREMGEKKRGEKENNIYMGKTALF